MSLLTALQAMGLSPRADEPLAKRGYWRIGGPADVWVDVPNSKTLAKVMGLGEPVTVVGRGSNLLVADRGIRGIVVALTGDHRESSWDHNELSAGGGLFNTVLLSRMQKARMAGLACLAGVPGTVGGAVRMNAGTRLGETGDSLTRVELVLADGEQVQLTRDEITFHYRRADLPPGAIVTRAWFRTDSAGFEQEQQGIAAHLEARKRTQPLDQPSCGSVFKNPPDDHAGRLLDSLGMKGTRIGGAQISNKHANFIVNVGGATAEDVAGLVRMARDRVLAETGITLEPEVHAVGDWEQNPF